MTLYLQRLLDRAAAEAHSAATQPAEALPALLSGSPVLSFDQRLGETAFAEDFGIVGASPPQPDVPEVPFAALTGTPAASPVSPQAPDEPPARERGAAAPRRRTTRPAAAEPVPAAETMVPESSPLSESGPSRRPERRSPSPEAADPAAAPDRAVPWIDREILRPAAAPAPEVREPLRAKAETVSPAPTDAGRATGSATRVESSRPHFAKPDAPAAEQQDRVRPAAPAPAPIREADAGPLAHGDRRAEARAPRAVPVVTPLPPLDAPPVAVATRDVEQMVSEAVRGALSRQAAPEPRSERIPKEVEGPGAGPAKRPATAAEASVIGKLESSFYSPMLFGVRRR